MNLRFCSLSSIVSATLVGILLTTYAQQEKKPNPINVEIVEQAQRIMGLNFDLAKRDSMLGNLADQLESYEKIRSVPLQNSVPPAILFNPIPVGFQFQKVKKPFRMSRPGKVLMPKDIKDIGFYSVGQLAELIRTRKITSERLTRMYLNRLKKYGPKLECVISLTEDLALAQAKKADAEIAKGNYRGPLHGIPFGVKDLLAVKG